MNTKQIEERKIKDRNKKKEYRKTEKYKEYRKKYISENRERRREYDSSPERKKARNEYNRRHRKTEIGRRALLAQWLKRKWGITLKERDDLIRAQGGVCAICGGVKWGGRWGQPHLDHNHKTGEKRKFLCQSCNVGIGMFLESVCLGMI